VQSGRLPQFVGFIHIRVAENLGAGCVDRVVKSAEKDHPFSADLDLRACHASPPSQEISATERRFGGANTADSADTRRQLITYNRNYT
jgi:hypothetical protein